MGTIGITVLIALGAVTGTPGIQVSQSDARHLVFEFNVPSVDTQTVWKDGEAYLFFYHEPYVTTEEGYPLLSAFPVRFAIPPGTHPVLRRLQVLEQERIPLSIPVMTAGPFEDEGLDFQPAPLKIHHAFPEDLAGPIEVGYQRHRKVGALRLYPFQWDPQTRTLQIRKRIRVEIVFEPDAEGTEKDLPYAGPDPFQGLYQDLINAKTAQTWGVQGTAHTGLRYGLNPFDRGEIWVRIPIAERGLYEIRYEDLVDLGLVGPFLSTSIGVFSYGPDTLPGRPVGSEFPQWQPVHILMEDGGDGSFDPGDRLLFFATDAVGYRVRNGLWQFTRNPYTDTVVYWLGIGLTVPPSQVAPIDAHAVDQWPVMDTSHGIVRHEVEEINTGKKGILWLGEELARPQNTAQVALEIPLTLPPLAHSQGFTHIRVATLTSLQRRIRLLLNGQELVQWTPYGMQLTEQEVQTSLLHEGENTVKIVLDTLSGTIGEADLLYVDYIEIGYTQRNVIQNADLTMVYQASSALPVQIEVQGPLPPFVLDITDEFRTRYLTNLTPISGGFRFSDTLRQTQVYYLPTEIRHPPHLSLVNDFSLRQPGLGADLVIIAPGEFVSTLDELVRWKRENLFTYNPATDRWEKTGGRVLVVPVEKIFDQFGFGAPDPTAIRDFLRFLYEYGDPPEVTFALLVGDGTYDYKNILGQGGNLIPPYEPFDDVINVNDNRPIGAWDGYFGEFTGDQYSEIFIGRLPVRDREELSLNIQKIITYERGDAIGPWRNRVVLVSDDDWTNGHPSGETIHTRDNDNIYREIIPRTMEVRTLYPIEEPPPQRWLNARQRFAELLNQGSLIFNVFGHGNPRILFHEAIFSGPTDYSRIDAGFRNTLVIIASCKTGAFDRVDLPHVIGEELAVTRGGIATISATSVSYAGSNALYAKTMISKALDGDPHPLGELEETGKNNKYYVLLGDPSLCLGTPSPELTVQLTNSSPIEPGDTLETARFYSYQIQQGGVEPGATYVLGFGPVREVTYDPPVGYPITYLRPPTRYYVAEISETSGFTGQFLIPPDNDLVGFPAKVTAYQPRPGWGYVGLMDSLAITPGPLPSDSGGPHISLLYEGQPLRDSMEVPSEFLLQIRLSDEHGIYILPDTLSTGEFGISLILDGDLGHIQNLTPFFMYEGGSGTTGTVFVPVQFQEGGYHTLQVVAYDNLYPARPNPLDSRSAKEVTVYVLGGAQRIENLLLYPNPLRDRGGVYITFDLMQPTRVKIQVYTITGRLIWAQEVPGVQGYNQIYWNGRDFEGDIPANGLYYIRVQAMDGDRKVAKIEKLLIAR